MICKTNKRALFFGILLLLMFCFTGCSDNTENLINSDTLTWLIIDVSIEDANNLIQENADNPEFVLVDMRTPEEYNTDHINSALNLDYRADSFTENLSFLDKTKTYMIYCNSGNRSKKSQEIMQDMGFPRVINVLGGIKAWRAEGLPTVQ